MNDLRKCGLAWTAFASIALSGCGGGSSDTDQEPPLHPAPALTYSPDAAVCEWMDAHIVPFRWPEQVVGPRNWQPAAVDMVDMPVRNAQGLALYEVHSSTLVLHGHYGPEIQAKGLAVTSEQLWAQEASCRHGIHIESTEFYLTSTSWTAHIPDSTANRIAHEEYTASIAQVAEPHPCNPGPVFAGALPPPACRPITP